MFQKILLAYDGSEGAEKALDAALELARVHQGKVWALAVEENLPHITATVGEFQESKEKANEKFGKLLHAARSRAEKAGVELKTLLRAGHPAKTIINVAREGEFDVILVGHSGLSGVWAAFLGTTAEKVSRHAPCSVLIVR
jgi:nucleotide-binding universal stress UspA family protein|uniref:Universal stress protein n=1 Tax=Desulfobacca acetoxidans TaxID=60893 RepID=A0A7C3Z1T9_9BACT